MSVYPYPENLTGLTGLMNYNNTVTNDAFGVFLIIPLWLVLFGIASQYSGKHAITAASFSCFLICTGLVIAGVLGIGIMFLLLAMTIVGLIFGVISR